MGGDINTYTDNSNGANNYYAVQTLNANGAGVMSPRVQPTPLETPCVLPGLTVATDLSDALPNSPPVPQVDLWSVHIGEPYMNGAQKMVFTLKLAGGGALPPNSQWYIL